MSKRRNKPRNSPTPAETHGARPTVADVAGARPTVAAFWGRPWLLAGMTALLVARPLFPSESAAVHGDGLVAVMLWLALAVLWSLAAVGRRKPRNSPLPLGEGPGVRAAERVQRTDVGGPAASAAGAQPQTAPDQGPRPKTQDLRPKTPTPNPLSPFPAARFRFGWIDVAVVLFLLWQAAATFWAVRHGSPRPAINVFWEWIGLGLCFLLARQLIETQRECRALAAVMIALAVALSGYGLYQRAYEMPASRALYRADPDAALREAGTWYPPGSPQRKLFEDRLANDEPMATFALTNSLAGFLAPWLVVLAGIACSDLRNRKLLLSAAAVFAPIAVCLFLTHSRGGCLAALLGIALVWPVARETSWKIPLAILMAGAVLIGAAAAAGKLDYETAQKSLGYRLQYWQSTAAMIGEHPWLGCGPGNFKNAYTRYKLPEASEEIADPHNFLLEIWSTAGTPAALAFLAVLGCFAWGCMSAGIKPRPAVAENGATDGRGFVIERENAAREYRQNHQSEIINHKSPDAWRHVLAGGAAGFLLSLPLGMLSAAPPAPTAVALGLPLAAIAVALLFGWIRDGHLPRLLPALAVAVLLVNLLAAGGIALPGVAGSLWLLMAMGLCLCNYGATREFSGRRHVGLESAKQADVPSAAKQSAAWNAIEIYAPLAAAVALAIVFYFTASSPVLKCRTHMELAASDPARAAEHLEAAAAADPWSAEPWRRLADLEFNLWLQTSDIDAYRRFERAVAALAWLNPESSETWSTIGDWYALAASKTDRLGNRADPYAVNKRAEACCRAVEFYPNSAMNRAKLAEAFLALGNRRAFRSEAETALRLDAATPHADKKLPAPLRRKLTADLSEK